MEEQHKFRLAIGSFMEVYNNQVAIIQYDPEKDVLVQKAMFNHSYPATKIMWHPKSSQSNTPDLLATTADYLRLFEVQDNGEVKSMYVDLWCCSY